MEKDCIVRDDWLELVRPSARAIKFGLNLAVTDVKCHPVLPPHPAQPLRSVAL